MRACPKCGRDCGGNGGPCTPRSDPRDAEIAQLKAELAAWKRIANIDANDAMEHRALAEAAEAQVERFKGALHAIRRMYAADTVLEAYVNEALAPTPTAGEAKWDTCFHDVQRWTCAECSKPTPPAREEKDLQAEVVRLQGQLVEQARLYAGIERPIPRAVAVEAVGLLRWLDNGGGLGLEVHSRLRSVEKKLRAALGLP